MVIDAACASSLVALSQAAQAIVAGSVPYRSSLLAIIAHPAASQPVQLHDHAVPSLLRTEIEPTVALRVLSARVVAVSGAACALITECEYATMHEMHTKTASKCIGASEESRKYLAELTNVSRCFVDTETGDHC